MGQYNNPISKFVSSDYWKHRVIPPEIYSSGQISQAIRIIESRWPQISRSHRDDEAPIFILAAAWGSGSTLIQRLVVSSDDVLIWGEPFDHAVPIHRLAQMIIPVTYKWPRDQYFDFPSEPDDLPNSWIANLTPDIESMRLAHREFLINWLKVPSLRRGRSHWGLKDVRLTIDHARYLKWLFPNCRFLFMHRDVIDSYRSCKDVGWYNIWPDFKVSRTTSFAHHWVHLASGFFSGHDDIGGYIIKYDDLVNEQVDLAEVSNYLKIPKMNKNVLTHRIGSRKGKTRNMNSVESFLINSISYRLRKALGYT